MDKIKMDFNHLCECIDGLGLTEAIQSGFFRENRYYDDRLRKLSNELSGTLSLDRIQEIESEIYTIYNDLSYKISSVGDN